MRDKESGEGERRAEKERGKGREGKGERERGKGNKECGAREAEGRKGREKERGRGKKRERRRGKKRERERDGETRGMREEERELQDGMRRDREGHSIRNDFEATKIPVKIEGYNVQFLTNPLPTNIIYHV